MKKINLYLFSLYSVVLLAQQTPVYTQYTFNKAGVNPAASGTDINQEYTYTFGMNKYWTDFNKAPTQSFVNVSYTIRPPYGYKSWQNVGVYIDHYSGGLFTNTSIYANYTYHKLLRKKLVASFGVYVGARRFLRSQGGFDTNDPAVYKTSSAVTIYPDIIPGFRFSSKKYFAGISLRQISLTKLKDFKGRKIGSPSKLQPTLFAEYGQLFTLGDHLLMMPSVAVNLPLIGPPLYDVNLMFYYANRIGLGASLRNTSFLSGIFQLRFFENLTLGFAYSYPINLMRYASQNSFEIIIGIVPMGMNAVLTGRHSIAKCPSITY